MRPSGGTSELAVSCIARLRGKTSHDSADPDVFGLRQGMYSLVEYARRLAARRTKSIDVFDADDVLGIFGVMVLRDKEGTKEPTRFERKPR